MANNYNSLNKNSHNFDANNKMAESKIQIFDNKVCKAPPTYDDRWRNGEIGV